MGPLAIPDEVRRSNPKIDEFLAQRAMQTGMGTPQGPADRPAASPMSLGQPAAPAEPDAHVQVTHTLAPAPAVPMTPLAKAQPIKPPEPSPAELTHQTEYNRLTGAGPNPAEGKSGIGQIKNPVSRTLLTALDAIGSGLFPRIAENIPGTQAHHNELVGQAQGALKQEQGARAENAKEELEAARAEHQINPPVTKEWQEIAGGATNPEHPELGIQPAFYNKNDPKEPIVFGNATIGAKPGATKEPQFVRDGQGNIVGFIDDKGQTHGANDPKLDPQAKAIIDAAKAKEPTVQEGERPLGPFADQMNAANLERYQVLHKGAQLPAQYRLTPQSTQKQADEIRNLLSGTESAEGVKTARDQAVATAAANRSGKTDAATRKAAMDAYAPALDSAERFNVMAKNYEDAVKNHDQQAMLSLLANHLGMTMGLQKGARMTRDIIREAQQSRPWLQGLAAKFDKDGYLSGVNLTAPQMQQMVSLGRERFSEDISKAGNQARYMGVTDEGPGRTPNRSTINFYTAMANGDPKRAKELAAADGWSVK